MVSYSESGEMTVDYKQLRSKDYKAEDYKADETLAKGPKDNRKCTDVLCFCAYWVVVVVMFVWCIFAYINGDPAAFFYPVSYGNQVCGLAANNYQGDLTAYPYLFIPDVQKISDTTIKNLADYTCCSDACPTGQNTPVQVAACGPLTNKDGSETLADGSTVEDTYQTTDWHKYCLPVDGGDASTAQQNGISVLSTYYNVVQLGNFVMSLYQARWVLLISVFIALALALMYIKFMDWCAYWVAWAVVIMSQLSMIGLAVLSTVELTNCKANPECKGTGTQSAYAAATWIAWIFAALFCLCLMCKFKALRVSIAIIETAADFFADSKRIILVPIIYLCVALGVFALWFFGIMCLSAAGQIKGDTDNQDVTSDRTALQNDRIAWMVIFYIWIATMIHALNEYCIIVSTCTWYFSRKDIPDDDGIPGDSDIWKGFWWSYRYNFGSLAFGSAVLTLVTLLKDMISYLGDAALASTGGNPCTACIVCCCDCIMNCFDRCVRFLNMNAYIYMALSGDGFCISAMHSFLVVLKNAAKFSFVNSIAGFFMILAKLTISILTTLAAYGILMAWPDSYDVDGDDQPGYLLPCLTVFVLSYVIAAMFIGIFDISSNTILMCYIWDYEIAKSGGHLDASHIPATLNKFLKAQEGDLAIPEEDIAANPAAAEEVAEKENLIS